MFTTPGYSPRDEQYVQQDSLFLVGFSLFRMRISHVRTELTTLTLTSPSRLGPERDINPGWTVCLPYTQRYTLGGIHASHATGRCTMVGIQHPATRKVYHGGYTASLPYPRCTMVGIHPPYHAPYCTPPGIPRIHTAHDRRSRSRVRYGVTRQ